MKKALITSAIILFLVIGPEAGKAGFVIFRLTNNTTNDSDPSLYNGTVAWIGIGGSDDDIFYWDGSTTVNVSDNAFCCDDYPSLFNGAIAWEGSDFSDSEIYYWNGTNITKVTDNNVSDKRPSHYNGTVAWEGGDGNDFEIYFWNGTTTINVSNSNDYDDLASLHNGTIFWRRWDGNDYEIFFWDGNTTTQITNNNTDEERPSNYNGTVAWVASDGNDFEIYYWNGTSTTQVTNNGTNDDYPSLYNGTIAWQASDGNDLEIYYWDGTSISTVTNNSSDDTNPSLYNGRIAFVNNSEIYYAIPGSADDDDIEVIVSAGCFIATAAYGSRMESEVKVLRDFRNRFLLSNSFGKILICLYNRHSPNVANFIAKYDILRAMVRMSLLPFVGVCWVALRIGSAYTVFFLLIFCVVLFGVRRFIRGIIPAFWKSGTLGKPIPM